jgi:hypothetical protein
VSARRARRNAEAIDTGSELARESHRAMRQAS